MTHALNLYTLSKLGEMAVSTLSGIVQWCMTPMYSLFDSIPEVDFAVSLLPVYIQYLTVFEFMFGSALIIVLAWKIFRFFV